MNDRELMQMALEALDKAAKEIYSQNDDDEIGHARRALRAALAQPELGDGYCQACDGDSCTAKEGCVALDNPPQREWQGLTDDEIDDMMPYAHNEFDILENHDFARAIEAKLKEKNCA